MKDKNGFKIKINDKVLVRGDNFKVSTIVIKKQNKLWLKNIGEMDIPEIKSIEIINNKWDFINYKYDDET